MTNKQYVAVIVGPITIITILISLFNVSLHDISTNRIENIKIEVTYSGSWEGVLYSNEKVQMVSGFTSKTIVVYRPTDEQWTVSFEVEKIEDSRNQLKVVYKFMNGTRIDEAQTIDPYGKVVLTQTIG
jgi:hypothetical protein